MSVVRRRTIFFLPPQVAQQVLTAQERHEQDRLGTSPTQQSAHWAPEENGLPIAEKKLNLFPQFGKIMGVCGVWIWSMCRWVCGDPLQLSMVAGSAGSRFMARFSFFGPFRFSDNLKRRMPKTGYLQSA